jgi:uncharacterized delta-60 repeat protein
MRILSIALILICHVFSVTGQSPQIDYSFDPANGFGNGGTWTINTQVDNKIIIGGDFQNYNGNSVSNLCRLNPDGLIDNTFNIGNGFSGSFNMFFGSCVYSTAIQSDGKIIVGGNFFFYNNLQKSGICRLNIDGTNDPTFNSLNGFNGAVRKVCLQTDGKIIVGGDFSSYNSTPVNRICRLNSDGTLDLSFTTGTGFNDAVVDIKLQQDNKILVGGYFTQFNGQSKNKIIRLNTNGTADLSFNIGSGFGIGGGGIWSIAIQTDGKIIVGGMIYSFNGQTISNICRLNPNGSIDLSFQQGSGFNNPTYTLSLQTDGKIIIGGGFTTYNGTGRNYIIRLNTNGSIDTNFDIIPGIGLNSQVLCSYIQNDNKILVGGQFTALNNISRNGIVRLLNTTNTTICSGSDINYNLINLQGQNTTFQWSAISNLDVIGESNNTQYGSILNDTLVNSTTSPQIVIYTITPLINNIAGNIQYHTVTVNPIPDLLTNPPIQTICCQSNATVMFYGNVTNTIFEWNANVNPNTSGYPLNGNGYFSAIIDNSTSVSQSVNFTVFPNFTNNGVTCLGDTQNFSITVLPCPSSLIVTNLSDQYLCPGDTMDTFIFEGTASSYPWYNFNFNNNIGIGNFSGQDTLPGFIAQNNTSNTIVVPIIIIPSYDNGSCQGYPDTMNITVYPNSIVNAGLDLTVCEGEEITLIGSGAAIYQWSNNITNNQPFQAFATTEYSMSGIDSNGCIGYDTVNVIVNPTIYSTQIETALDSYTWPVNGDTFFQSGIYIDTLLNSSGCDSIITLDLTLNFTGLNQEKTTDFNLYPNPAIDQITIITNESLIGKHFLIFDQVGRLVHKGSLNNTYTTLSLIGFSIGMYTLQIDGQDRKIFVICNE